MTLLARIGRWLLGVLVAAGSLVYLLRRRPPAGVAAAPLDPAIAQARQDQVVADARLAVEMAAGRAVAGKARDELMDALKDDGDEEQQNERLIDLAAKERGE
jgi:DNA-binding GntR family transcriptional regulator